MRDHNLTAQQVIEKAQAGLSGTADYDIRYLDKFADRYVDHPEGPTIVREIGRMIAGLMSPEQLARFEDVLEDDGMADFDEQLSRAHEMVAAGDCPEAREALTSLLERYTFNALTEDALNEYRCFGNDLEHALYEATRASNLTLRMAPNNYAHAHFLIGFCSVALDEVEKAEAPLRRAVSLNPVSPIYLYELGEVLKMRGLLDDFRAVTVRAMYFAYTDELLARGYRNLGFLASEERDFAHAAELFVFSLEFDEGGQSFVENELEYIAAHDGLPEPVSVDQIAENLGAAGIQVGPSDLVRAILESSDTE